MRATAGVLFILVLALGVCSAQLPSHYISINIPGEVHSENVFIRYILAGEDIGGWIQPKAGVSSYIIGTTHEGKAADRIKAILYAPGCAIQTLDLPLSDSDNPQYSFVCRSLAATRINGKVTQAERFSGREIKLQARYVARWASDFFGLSANIPLTIPVSDVVDFSAENGFQVSIPDLSQDMLAAAPDHPGELQIWAKDKSTGNDVAQLDPVGTPEIQTRTGGLKIQNAYPAEIVFAPCALSGSIRLIQRDGFTIRDFTDPCDR